MLKYEFFPKGGGGGGVPAEPKVLRHFLFALKQSKANKLKFLLNNIGKSEKSASKIPKVRGGSEAFWKKLIFKQHFLCGKLPFLLKLLPLLLILLSTVMMSDLKLLKS